MKEKRKRVTHERSKSKDNDQATLSQKKRLPKKTIKLKLQIPGRSYETLRRYVKKHFETTLEKQLMNVLVEWIGKAIGHISELQRNSKDPL